MQGVPRTYDDHLLIIGDAAGHIDPLTGEGIHTAMMARPKPSFVPHWQKCANTGGLMLATCQHEVCFMLS